MTAFGRIRATLVHRHARVGESRIDAKKRPAVKRVCILDETLSEPLIKGEEEILSLWIVCKPIFFGSANRWFKLRLTHRLIEVINPAVILRCKPENGLSGTL